MGGRRGGGGDVERYTATLGYNTMAPGVTGHNREIRRSAAQAVPGRAKSHCAAHAAAFRQEALPSKGARGSSPPSANDWTSPCVLGPWTTGPIYSPLEALLSKGTDSGLFLRSPGLWEPEGSYAPRTLGQGHPRALGSVADVAIRGPQ